MTVPQIQRVFPGPVIPDMPSLSLSDDEQRLVAELQSTQLIRRRERMELAEAYYLGEAVVHSLGIAIPRELDHLRMILGWPAKAIDPLVMRLSVEGFRLPDATDVDADLWDLWQANDMDAEQYLAYTDALVMGHAYISVGSGLERGDPPRFCVESPLHIAVSWDLQSREPQAAFHEYREAGDRFGALMLPDQTIELAARRDGAWEVIGRDEHKFGRVPLVRMANRPTTRNRDGRSEITPSVMSITDAACRKMINLEVASELYSVPQKYVLGAVESDFQNPDGTPRRGWETYITKVLGLERDEDGQLPQVGQFTAYDPSTYTRVIDMYAARLAGELNATPQEFGLYTEGNPPSADSIKFTNDGRDRHAVRLGSMLGRGMVKVMQFGLMFQNGGRLPDQYLRLETDWADPATPTPVATSQAIVSQIAAGSIPATSDVTLKRLGYSAVERARLAADRTVAEGNDQLTEITRQLASVGQQQQQQDEQQLQEQQTVVNGDSAAQQ